MAERKTPELNLQPELPNVVSRDFNLFYKPEPKPEIAGLKEFTQSLDNFINDAGKKMVLASEYKEKELNEAEAVELYNSTRGKFNDLVNQGKIPKEANPYFIDKYKELELGDKAREFGSFLRKRYVEKGVVNNGDANAFNQFYDEAIKEFFTSNQLGLYEPSMLAKSFFKQSDGIRNELYSQHSNSQMAKISDNYKKSFKNGVQNFFTNDGSPDAYKNIGNKITEYIKDKTANGLSNETAREYLFEALTDFVEGTTDTDFARKVLNEVPKHIYLGTDALGNVVGLQDEFSKIEDKLYDREVALETREQNKYASKVSKEKRFIIARVNDEEFDALEFKSGDEYKTLTKDAKEFYEQYVQKGTGGFSNTNNREVEGQINDLIKKGLYDEAENYLLKVGSSQLKEATYKEYFNKIIIDKAVKKEPVLNNQLFEVYKDNLEKDITRINKNGIVVSPQMVDAFNDYAQQWVFDNKAKYPNPSELSDAFEKAMTDKFNLYRQMLSGKTVADTPAETADLSKLKTENNSTSKPEQADMQKLTRKDRRNQKPTDKELEIDLTKVVVIPEGLSGAELRKFRRDNRNSITKEDYDRISQKQLTNNLAKQAGNETTGGST